MAELLPFALIRAGARPSPGPATRSLLSSRAVAFIKGLHLRAFERGETMHLLIPLGRLVMTRNAFDVLVPEDVAAAVLRHGTGDWGDLGEEDKAANDAAVLDGSRILSAYRDRRETRFWIITEADRSSTTVLLPADY